MRSPPAGSFLWYSSDQHQALGWSRSHSRGFFVLGLVSATAAWRCGPGPGIVATFLAAGYSAWTLVLPLHLSVASVEGIMALVLSILAGILVALLSAAR